MKVLVALLLILVLMAPAAALDRTRLLDERYSSLTINSTYLETTDGDEAFLTAVKLFPYYNPYYAVSAVFTGDLNMSRSAGHAPTSYPSSDIVPQRHVLFFESDSNVTGVSWPLISLNSYNLLEFPNITVRLFVNQSEDPYLTIGPFYCDELSPSNATRPMEECVLDFFSPPVGASNLTDLAVMPAGSFLQVEYSPYAPPAFLTQVCGNVTYKMSGQDSTSYYSGYGYVKMWSTTLGEWTGTGGIFGKHDASQLGYYPCVGTWPTSDPAGYPIASGKGKLGADACGSEVRFFPTGAGCPFSAAMTAWPSATSYNSSYQIQESCYGGFGPYYSRNMFNWYGQVVGAPAYAHVPGFSFSTNLTSGQNFTYNQGALCSTSVNSLPVPPEPDPCDVYLARADASGSEAERNGHEFGYFICKTQDNLVGIILAFGIFAFIIGFSVMVLGLMRKRLGT